MFEQAVRQKLRFKLSNGFATTEDLWDLSLQSLDTLAKSLNKQVKESEEESFISTKTKENKELELKFEVVKHIIKVKLDEAAEKKTRLEKAQRKAKIKEILEEKENESLKGKSTEELLKELDNL